MHVDDTVIVRCPALPVEAWMSEPAQWPASWHERVARAVAQASPSLASAAPTERARLAALKYQIRMSTRPTPFGLMATMAIAEYGSYTDLRISNPAAYFSVRSPASWLVELSREAEDDPVVLPHLHVWPNSALEEVAGWFRLPDEVGPRATRGQAVSIRATRSVRRLFRLAATGPLAADLCDALADSDAGRGWAERLVRSLVANGLLCTDLQVCLTDADPPRRLLSTMRSRDPTGRHADRLAGVLAAADRANADLSAGTASAGAGDPRSAFASTNASSAGGHTVGQPPHGWHIDTAAELAGTHIGSVVGREAIRAAELMLAVGSQRDRLAANVYHHAFEDRYGAERLVPLLELLDPDRGLGQLGPSHGTGPPEGADWSARDAVLLRLAGEAGARREPAVKLTPELISELQTNDHAQLPAESVELFFSVAAPSAAAVDRGNFRLRAIHVSGPTSITERHRSWSWVQLVQIGPSQGKRLSWASPVR